MKKVIICGNYGGINTGDEAMLEGLLHFWHKKADITVLSHNSKHTHSSYNVKSAHVLPMGPRSNVTYRLSGRMKKSIELIEQADLFVLGGGSLFTDEENEKAPAMWAVQANEAIKRGVPLIMLGQSIGPLNKEYNQNLVAEIFNKAKSTYVRDQKSQNALKELGINSTLIGDLALLLKEKYSNPPANNAEDIILIPRDWRRSSHILKKIKKQLEELSNSKLKLVSFNREKESFEDAETKRKSCLMPYEALQIMAASKLLVSMRLHGSILASVANKAFLALSYSPKVESFCREMAHPYFISLENFNEEKFAALFHSLLKQKDLIESNLDRELAEKLKQLKKELISILEDL